MHKGCTYYACRHLQNGVSLLVSYLPYVKLRINIPEDILMFFLTVHHSINLFHLPTLMHNSFIH